MIRRLVPLAVLGGFFAVATLSLLSPYLHIKETSIIGNETITDAEIMARAGITRTTNLLLYNTGRARKASLENYYIDSVVFTKAYPDSLTIQITERRLTGYVEYMQGKYLFLDENGRVLEIGGEMTEKLPVVTGLKFDRFRLGEPLPVENAAAFKTIVRYARLLNSFGLADKVSRLDVSDAGNARIIYNRVEFNVGDDRNADEKIRTMIEIVNNMPNAELIKGIVDLRRLTGQYVLKVLV
jgi:hypothetical protein